MTAEQEPIVALNRKQRRAWARTFVARRGPNGKLRGDVILAIRRGVTEGMKEEPDAAHSGGPETEDRPDDRRAARRRKRAQRG